MAILGSISLSPDALHTHTDSYRLTSIVGVSTRRPFLGVGVLIALLLAAFGASFADILTPGELALNAAVACASFVVGLTVGQLTLISVALRGSRLADSVWGTYPHLNRIRPRIVKAVERAQGAEQ